jgi:hypothetical protein
MIGWGIAALFFIILITSFPGLQIILQTTSLNINYWMLIITLTIIGTFWIEMALLHEYGEWAYNPFPIGYF